MREIHFRKLHRYVGMLLAPFVLLQATSGLILSVDVLGRWQHQVQRYLEGVDLPALALFWNQVFYEIHFGSGRVGLLHNVGVGLGLLAMVLTGSFVFVMFLVRKFRSERGVRAAPSLSREKQGWAEVPVASRRRVGVALVAVALGLMALDIFIFSAAYRLIGLHVPHLYAAARVEVGIANGRAALEGLLAGDPRATSGRFDASLRRATTTAGALLERLEQPEESLPDGRDVLPVENRALRSRIVQIADGLHEIREHVSTQGLAATEIIRPSLVELQASARNLTEALMGVIERDEEKFFTIHLVLFSAAFLFLVAVGVVLYVYESARTQNLGALHAARDIAHAYERRFRNVIRNAADPLLVFDARGNVVAASLSAAYFLGHSEDELSTLNISDIDQCTSAEEREALWAEIEPGSPAAVKSCWRHRSGKDLPVALSLAVVDAETDEGAEQPLRLAQARRLGADEEG